jgi:hypothetical protein
MTDYRWLNMCSDDYLKERYEHALSRIAYGDAPKWKRYLIGSVIGLSLICGVGVTMDVLTRSSAFEQALILAGIGASVAALVLNREAVRRREMLEAIIHERDKRASS